MAHFKAHPDWYVGLRSGDSFQRFQLFLHQQRDQYGGRRCPMPCGMDSTRLEVHPALGTTRCHNTEPGEDCYNHVVYSKNINLPQHPEWYPGLDKTSSFYEIQAFLHEQEVCPKPCTRTSPKSKKQKERQRTAECDGLSPMGSWCAQSRMKALELTAVMQRQVRAATVMLP